MWSSKWPRWRCHESCSPGSWSGFNSSVYRHRWCSVADAETGRQVGDLSEERLMLRRDPEKPWLRRRERPDWCLGVPRGRPGGQGQPPDRRFSLASGGSPGYDSDLRSDKWEILAKKASPNLGDRFLGASHVHLPRRRLRFACYAPLYSDRSMSRTPDI